MFTCGPGLFTPAAGGGGGDPNFANVVLLLAGDSPTDLSPLAHVATSIGAGVTFDSSPSSSNGGVGSTSIRTNAAVAANWTYGTPAPEWRYNPVYTLEWWVYFDAQAANWIPLAATDFSRFMQYVGGTGSNLNGQGKWGGNVGGSIATGSWHWFVFVSDGVDGQAFLDGAAVSGLTVTAADGADKAFELLDLTAGIPNYRFMQVRYTQGVARYNPLALTIPMQTAPWPDFA